MDPGTMMAVAQLAMQAGQSFLGGDKQKKLSNWNSQQKDFFKNYAQNAQGMQQGFGQATSQLQQYMDPNSSIWGDMFDPYMKQFNQETIPGIAERFAGGGALSSSGFGQALGAAGGNLQSNLAQMKSGMMRQALMDYLGQYNQQAQGVMGAQPFSYMNQQGGGGGGGGSGIDFGNIMKIFQGFSGGNAGGTNQFGGGQTQFPLTNSYDQQFRQGGVF